MNNVDFVTMRPGNFSEFIGQKKIIDNLLVYIKSSVLKDTSLDHMLLVGAPGLGKTSLAYLIAHELNRNIIVINANSIERAKDIIVLLSKINEGDIVFIDEIHALNKNVEEILYSAMEDFYINLNVKDNTKKNFVKFSLPPFTLIGATTKQHSVSKPLLDRFGINFYFEDYSVDDIAMIIKNYCSKFKINITSDAIYEIALISRQIPRIAINYIKRIDDHKVIKNIKVINKSFVRRILKKIGVNVCGLTDLDIRYLNLLYATFNKTTVGLTTISGYLNEDEKTITEIIEPYLLKNGFVKKTPKGRIITDDGEKMLSKLKDII